MEILSKKRKQKFQREKNNKINLKDKKMVSKLRERNIRLLTAFNLIAYSCVTLSFGVFVGFGFGHYQMQRFILMRMRLEDMDDRMKILQDKYEKTELAFKQIILPKSEVLKKRSFSSNCTVSFDEGRQTTTENYTMATQLFGAVSGISIDLTTKANKMVCKADFTLNEYDKIKHQWEVKAPLVQPKMDFPLCWIAIPGNDFP